jgi:adenosylcobinamide kinase / adenosylcobinamide-phosphate guanylyltransferase
VNNSIHLANSELIIGGQRSGKSARAEQLAQRWLTQAYEHQAVFIATAQPHDAEMQQRIKRHQADRAICLPAMRTVEAPLHLAAAIAEHSTENTIIVVDCLTLWLTNRLFPFDSEQIASIEQMKSDTTHTAQSDYSVELVNAIQAARGPIIVVSNEIGLGVIPMGSAVRKYVDCLGRLNQHVAQMCQRVTLMAAGLPLTLKDLK